MSSSEEEEEEVGFTVAVGPASEAFASAASTNSNCFSALALASHITAAFAAR